VNKKIAVALSGSGRTLHNLLQMKKNFSYDIAAVIASSPHCLGVNIARKHDLPLFIADFGTKAASDLGDRLYEWLRERQISWIVLAGFLKKFPLRSDWTGRIINIHPALLPKFGGQGMYGNNVHKAVLRAKELETGATVHFVNEVYDDGEALAQIVVKVDREDTVESLASRVFAAECQLYPKVIDQLITGELPCADGHIPRHHYEP
jgi:folate-dependent phosphoribosylglycinamide formyltransferase PurN